MCLLLSFISHNAVLFFIFGMLPSIVSDVIDKTDTKLASRVIMSFNFSGISPYLFEMWNNQDNGQVVFRIMYDPSTWGAVYIISMLGWLAIWLFPTVMILIIRKSSQVKVIAYKEEQDRILDEWGHQIINKFEEYKHRVQYEKFMDEEEGEESVVQSSKEL